VAVWEWHVDKGCDHRQEVVRHDYDFIVPTITKCKWYFFIGRPKILVRMITEGVREKYRNSS
jgi:hypothetical protein